MIRRPICVAAALLLITVATTAQAQKPSPHEYDGKGVPSSGLSNWVSGEGLKRGKLEAQARLASLKTSFNAALRGGINGKLQARDIKREGDSVSVTFPSKEDKERLLASLRQKVDDAEALVRKPVPFFPTMQCVHLASGKVGRLCRAARSGEKEDQLWLYRVRQIVDKKNMVVIFRGARSEPVLVWMQMPTDGLVKDKEYSTEGQLFEVVGTKKYDAGTAGTKDIFHVVPRDPADYVD